MSGASTLTKIGSGTITLSGLSSYTGKTWIQQGALWVASLNKVSGGVASSALGAPTTALNGTIDLGSLTSTGTLITAGSLVAYESYLTGTPYTLSSNASNPWVLAKDLGQKWTFEADYLMNSNGGATTAFTYGSYTDGVLIRAQSADAIYTKSTAAGAFDLFGGSTTGGQFVSVKITFDSGTLKIYAAGVLLKTINGIGVLNPADKTIRLGAAPHNAGEGFDGQVKNIRITIDGVVPSTTTDRVINLAGTTGGGVLDQSGTDFLTYTGSVTATGAGAKTLTLQGSTTGTGAISGVISNNSLLNTTALLKQGTGTWTLSGANTYSGGTTLAAGTLALGTLAALSGAGGWWVRRKKKANALATSETGSESPPTAV
jgi:autotransporter-associated beta strand protein